MVDICRISPLSLMKMILTDLPNEVLLKVVKFLDCADRIMLEMVSRRLAATCKSFCVRENKIHIDSRFDTDAKASALLHRCGRQLEFLSTQVRLPQRFGDQQLLGHVCPKLRSIEFFASGSFHFTNVPARLCRDKFKLEILRMFKSLKKLENLRHQRCVVVSSDANFRLCMEDLLSALSTTQLRSLSVSSTDHLESICRLSRLEDLLMTVCDGSFDAQMAMQIGGNLKNLKCLTIIKNGGEIDFVRVVPVLVEQLPQLSTLVLHSFSKVFRLPKVDLSPYRNRSVRLNIFIDGRIRIFTGTSDRVQIVPLINYRGDDEAIKFISEYRQNGFDFNSHSNLKMLLEGWKSKFA